MSLRNFLRLSFAGLLLLLLMSDAASYAQSKSAGRQITVYQDPG
jgi:hypothetical protein